MRYEFQSTHPVRGATYMPNLTAPGAVKFQSTHPVRSATIQHAAHFRHADISIHAPRAGCDTGMHPHFCRKDISIHAPRAGCDMEINKARPWKHGFQSTHPVRGATRYSRMLGGSASFQSTHPVRGATNQPAE